MDQAHSKTFIILTPVAVLMLSLGTATGSMGQGIDCTCRLYPVANMGFYLIYSGEFRDTCKTPDGLGSCSPPVLVLLAGPFGLPAQACENGECDYTAAASSAAPPATWALDKPYSANFSFATRGRENPAFPAVFPGPSRPTTVTRQDFTLMLSDGGEAYARTFRGTTELRFATPKGGFRTKSYTLAAGMEIVDNDKTDNVVLWPAAHRQGAAGQPHCRHFWHAYPGDEAPTEHVVVLVDRSDDIE